MAKTVSLREYARIRGVRLNAVQTAIASGRIHKTPDGKIDVDEANREWFMNTDPAKSRKADPLFEAQPELSGGGRQDFLFCLRSNPYISGRISVLFLLRPVWSVR
mgnify:CR=1 FL=1